MENEAPLSNTVLSLGYPLRPLHRLVAHVKSHSVWGALGPNHRAAARSMADAASLRLKRSRNAVSTSVQGPLLPPRGCAPTGVPSFPRVLTGSVRPFSCRPALLPRGRRGLSSPRMCMKGAFFALVSRTL